jgi:hypothetical protein
MDHPARHWTGVEPGRHRAGYAANITTSDGPVQLPARTSNAPVKTAERLSLRAGRHVGEPAFPFGLPLLNPPRFGSGKAIFFLMFAGHSLEQHPYYQDCVTLPFAGTIVLCRHDSGLYEDKHRNCNSFVNALCRTELYTELYSVRSIVQQLI